MPNLDTPSKINAIAEPRTQAPREDAPVSANEPPSRPAVAACSFHAVSKLNPQLDPFICLGF